MVNSWLWSMEGMPQHSCTVVPMPVGFKTNRYIHGDGARNYMKVVVFVVAVHKTEGHEENVKMIWSELQFEAGASGEDKIETDMMLSHVGGSQPGGAEKIHAHQPAK